MANILIVDDSAMDRGLAGRLLEKNGDVTVSYASNGREAMGCVEQEPPDLIVSDLQMPEMNGLELVEAVRQDYPAVPVILMTARGSEEIASEALRKGAAGYVPKTALAQHLPEIVERTLSAANADRMHSRLMHSLQSDECTFRLDNDPELFEPLIAHIQQLLRCLPLGDEAERLRVSLAVKYALEIAHFHGNLEIPIDAELTDEQFDELADERPTASPWRDRSLLLTASISRDEAVFTVRHEGVGIDTRRLPEDLAAQAAENSWLSGFVLVPAVMDDVTFDASQRRIALLKHSRADELDDLDISDGE